MKISEKDKNIVAAVIASRGEIKGEDYAFERVAVCIKPVCGYNSGEVLLVHHTANQSIWKYICTIEEYNQCIEDMELAGWMCSIYRDYTHYKDMCKRISIYTSNKTLLKKNCIYDKPLVYTQDDYDNNVMPPIGCKLNVKNKSALWTNVTLKFSGNAHVIIGCNDKVLDQCFLIGDVQFLPTKTPEQIKQDKIDSQIKDLAIKYSGLFDDLDTSPLSFIAALQKDGYIVEPK